MIDIKVGDLIEIPLYESFSSGTVTVFGELISETLDRPLVTTAWVEVLFVCDPSYLIVQIPKECGGNGKDYMDRQKIPFCKMQALQGNFWTINNKTILRKWV